MRCWRQFKRALRRSIAKVSSQLCSRFARRSSPPSPCKVNERVMSVFLRPVVFEDWQIHISIINLIKRQIIAPCCTGYSKFHLISIQDPLIQYTVTYSSPVGPVNLDLHCLWSTQQPCTRSQIPHQCHAGLSLEHSGQCNSCRPSCCCQCMPSCVCTSERLHQLLPGFWRK